MGVAKCKYLTNLPCSRIHLQSRSHARFALVKALIQYRAHRNVTFCVCPARFALTRSICIRISVCSQHVFATHACGQTAMHSPSSDAQKRNPEYLPSRPHVQQSPRQGFPHCLSRDRRSPILHAFPRPHVRPQY